MIGCNPALSNQGYSNPSASDALIELSKWRVRQGFIGCSQKTVPAITYLFRDSLHPTMQASAFACN